MEFAILIAALFLAFNNGANDNFKGFATVWGSGTLSYRQALTLATLATVLGGVVSLFLAQALVQQFSGKGLVPDDVARAPEFILSVAVGAAMTIMLATRLGFPVSTTHALIGGLCGAGIALNSGALHYTTLLNSFLVPMLLSPILAALLGLSAYRLIRKRVKARDCLCIVEPQLEHTVNGTGTLAMHRFPELVVGDSAACAQLDAPLARVSISKSMDRVHTLSAAAICFARGVNDTPKLAALLLASHALGSQVSVIAIVIAMGAGGLLFSRRVAETMSKKMTRLDETSGLAANLITASLVLFASKFGVPVSTTHVSVGSIAGVGAGLKTVNWRTVGHVLLSWVVTLPLAASWAWLLAVMVAR